MYQLGNFFSQLGNFDPAIGQLCTLYMVPSGIAMSEARSGLLRFPEHLTSFLWCLAESSLWSIEQQRRTTRVGGHGSSYFSYIYFLDFSSKSWNFSPNSILDRNLTNITVWEPEKRRGTMKYSDKTDKHIKTLRIFWNFPEIPAFREKIIHLLKTRKITLTLT